VVSFHGDGGGGGGGGGRMDGTKEEIEEKRTEVHQVICMCLYLCPHTHTHVVYMNMKIGS
jgi:hypothetical protein